MRIYRVFYENGFWADEATISLHEAWGMAHEIARKNGTRVISVKEISK